MTVVILNSFMLEVLRNVYVLGSFAATDDVVTLFEARVVVFVAVDCQAGVYPACRNPVFLRSERRLVTSTAAVDVDAAIIFRRNPPR